MMKGNEATGFDNCVAFTDQPSKFAETLDAFTPPNPHRRFGHADFYPRPTSVPSHAMAFKREDNGLWFWGWNSEKQPASDNLMFPDFEMLTDRMLNR